MILGLYQLILVEDTVVGFKNLLMELGLLLFTSQPH